MLNVCIFYKPYLDFVFPFYSKLLTGLEDPTSGDVDVLGMSVRDRWSEVQEALGLCPQHSVLYPDLTAREHLRLYGRLKKGSGEVGRGVEEIFVGKCA